MTPLVGAAPDLPSPPASSPVLDLERMFAPGPAALRASSLAMRTMLRVLTPTGLPAPSRPVATPDSTSVPRCSIERVCLPAVCEREDRRDVPGARAEPPRAMLCGGRAALASAPLLPLTVGCAVPVSASCVRSRGPENNVNKKIDVRSRPCSQTTWWRVSKNHETCNTYSSFSEPLGRVARCTQVWGTARRKENGS